MGQTKVTHQEYASQNLQAQIMLCIKLTAKRVKSNRWPTKKDGIETVGFPDID